MAASPFPVASLPDSPWALQFGSSAGHQQREELFVRVEITGLMAAAIASAPGLQPLTWLPARRRAPEAGSSQIRVFSNTTSNFCFLAARKAHDTKTNSVQTPRMGCAATASASTGAASPADPCEGVSVELAGGRGPFGEPACH
jgi:hypothetical protein